METDSNRVAMRAPLPGKTRGATVASIRYEVNDQGVVMAHTAHVQAFRSLGYHLVSAEQSVTPTIDTLSPEELALLQERRLAASEKAKAVDAAKASEAASDAATDPPKGAPAKK